ncbi:hypothetical protein BEN78_15115 [Xanthomonas citri pv. mangiferaeindicae]|nr:hypothetical protein BEN78_15115 [Xanthomonas citri pv. mangiferaeindicae]
MRSAGIERKRHVGRPSEAARLHFPPSALTGCVHIAIERDTRGLALTSAERINMYPASPLPSVSWILDGHLHMVDIEGGAPVQVRAEPLPTLVFAGPFRKPAASWSPGPIHALMVSFYPDALARLWGIRLQDYVDTVIPAEQVLPAEALAALSGIGASDAPLDTLEARLTPLWQDAQQATDIVGIRSWLTSLTARGARTRLGVGMRQVQRRIKHLTGQSQRDLDLYARIEGAFEYAARHAQDLATVAANAGYSDQSHLGREVKRVTGLSARQLRDKTWQDEAFWLYRLLDASARNASTSCTRPQTPDPTV